MTVLYKTPTQRVELHSDQDCNLTVRTLVNQDQIVQSNQRLQNADLLKPGDRAAIHPKGAEAIYHFQIDPVLWKIYRREHPDVYAGLMSKSQVYRERAAAKLAAEHPEWVACAPKVLRFNHG